MDREKFITTFEKTCEHYNTKCITDLNNISFLSKGVNAEFICNNGHDYKTNIGNPECEVCKTNENDKRLTEQMINDQKKQDVLTKIKLGMKIESYIVNMAPYVVNMTGCLESYPCQHYVKVVLADGSTATLLMYNGKNILDNKLFH